MQFKHVTLDFDGSVAVLKLVDGARSVSDIADELAKLQDQVPPFPAAEARASFPNN